MKKVISKVKTAFKWYFNAVVTTGAMCPSCMVPTIGSLRLDTKKEKTIKNNSKAA